MATACLDAPGTTDMKQDLHITSTSMLMLEESLVDAYSSFIEIYLPLLLLFLEEEEEAFAWEERRGNN